ncbi:MAG: phosphoesterase, partial [Thaumarchaeota archaeon]
MRLIEDWPAILLEKPVKTLLLADIHFGYESELADKGIQVPSQAYRLKELLVRVVEETGAERIIFLGDLKHQVPLSSWI